MNYLNQFSGSYSIIGHHSVTAMYYVIAHYLHAPVFGNYRPRSRGDNTFYSVRVCPCVSVRLSVGALLFEPFDLLP